MTSASARRFDEGHHHRSDRSPGTWFAVAAAVVFVLALSGYRRYLPDEPWQEWVFSALNLLALNFHRASEPAAVPVELEVARFSIHVLAAAALVVAWLTVARLRLDRRLCRQLHGHRVIVGTSQNAVELAVAYGGSQATDRWPLVVGALRRIRRLRDSPWGRKRGWHHQTVLVGALRDATEGRLRRAGVTVTGAIDEDLLAEVVANADDIVIAAASDQESLSVATQLGKLSTIEGSTVRLLLNDPGMARTARDQFEGRLGARLDVVCEASRIATTALRAFPPREDHTVAPAPVVVGQGTIAAALVRHMVHGWHRPASPLEVLCIGPDVAWAKEAAEEVGEAGVIWWDADAWPQRRAAQTILMHAARTRPTPDERSRRDEVGPLVWLVGLDAADAFTLASKLADLLTDARVVLLVDDPVGWSVLEHDYPTGTTVHPLPAGTLLSDPNVIATDQTTLLAEELLIDQRRWPRDEPSVLGDALGGAERFSDLSPTDTDGLLDLARAVPAILRRVGLHPSDEPQVPILLPEEVIAIATGLEELLGSPEGEAERYRLYEFAAHLPTLTSRIGMFLRRRWSPSSDLSADQIDRMAREVHDRYLAQQAASGNASGSTLAGTPWEELSKLAKESNRAQVRDLPVKLAGAGRTLQPLAAGAAPARDWLKDDETVDLLARWEHRRWCYLHRLAGYTFAPTTDHARREHAWLRPYDELGEVKGLDRSAIEAIPDLLAVVGLDTRPLEAPVSGTPQPRSVSPRASRPT